MEDYTWHTREPHANNETTMSDYLDNHIEDKFKILLQDGSYAELLNEVDNTIWGVHASGNGNFNNHRIRFELL